MQMPDSQERSIDLSGANEDYVETKKQKGGGLKLPQIGRQGISMSKVYDMSNRAAIREETKLSTIL